MKKGIGKNLRIAVISIASALIAVFSLLFYMEFTIPKFTETKVKVFSYSSIGSINYKVMLKPNMLYTGQSLEEGGIYITEFADSILVAFKYDYKGERSADLKGSYEIIAVVEGYEDEKKDYAEEKSTGDVSGKEKESGVKAIWKKEYRLTPETKFGLKDKALSIAKDILINYMEYNNFVQKVIEVSKLNTPTRLVVFMNVNLQAETDKGSIEDKAAQSIIIPLGTNRFNITETELGEKPGAIEEVQKIQLPLNRTLLIFYGVAAGLLIIILIYTIFFTKGKPGISQHLKALNSIFKKHGNRLVALSSIITADPGNSRTVRSMDDLVRIADEIQKPVFYGYDSDSNCISRFFVIDENWMYLFDLREFISETQDEDTKVEQILINVPNTAKDTDVES